MTPAVDPARPAFAGPRPRRGARARFWLLLAVTLLCALVCEPRPWRAAVRALLTWQAARQGCELSIDGMEGGPLDAFHLYGVHYRQHEQPAGAAAGTDLWIAHAEIAFAWTLPWQQRPGSPWVRRVTLDGVRGRLDLSADGYRRSPASGARPSGVETLAARLIPAEFLLRTEDATLRRGRYHLRARGLLLTGSHDEPGRFLARSLEAGGPGFEATLPDLHGGTLWQGERLTLCDLDLGRGVQLARATLDGSRLARRRLDCDCDLRALGGTVRAQGAVNFSRARLALELGGTVRAMSLGPLAGLLGIPGPADGRVEQASFSFRGDPENWQAAEMWLAGRATDFRWGERRWESLELQAVVTNRRVQVHRLELRQSRNRLSLDGECALPPDPEAAAEPGRWWQAGFACNVDARLEDLHDLAQLFGSPAPDVAGRMSVNGRLGARPGTLGFDGYLNVEGSRLSIFGAPLDYLRSTLIFRGEELEIADLQATHEGDYLAGHGSMHIAGPPRFQALGRVSVQDPGGYLPAGADMASIHSLTAGVRLEDSILHLDQCRGEQGGGTFEASGSVDLRDAAEPVLDLSLAGEQPPRMADPADAAAAWRGGRRLPARSARGAVRPEDRRQPAARARVL